MNEDEEKNETSALRKALNAFRLRTGDFLPPMAAEDAKEAAELREVSHRSGVATKEDLDFRPPGCDSDLRFIGGG